MTLDDILAKGFPTTRDEAWKYTNILPISSRPVTFASDKVVKLNCEARPLLYTAKLSDDIFENLNQYFPTEAYEIEAGSEDIEIFYNITATDWVQPRIKISIKENSKVRITEKFVSQQASITNAVTEIDVKENAKLTYIKIQDENDKAFHVGRTYINVHKNAQVKTLTHSKGSQLARSDIHVKLLGENASCELNGLYITKNRMHLDHHTTIEHCVPYTKSREFYRGILSDKSRAVFNGKVIVHAGAFKTEAAQANDNLLLSSDAEIDTKPELEIYCDDVSCTHGATIGQLDENALFYLRTRGIDSDAAKNILIDAFANKVLENFGDL